MSRFPNELKGRILRSLIRLKFLKGYLPRYNTLTGTTIMLSPLKTSRRWISKAIWL